MSKDDKSKNNKSGDSVSDLFVPFVELFVEIINLCVLGFQKLIILFGKWLYRRYSGSYKEKRKPIEPEMLLSGNIKIKDGAFGYSISHKKSISYTDIPFEAHTIMVGRTGQGKTNALMNIIDDSFKNDYPIIYIDPKGNRSAINEFRFIGKHYEKEALIFSETDLGNATFNPLKRLNNSQRAVLILNAFEWSDGDAMYYKDRTIFIILNEVIPAIEKANLNVSFPEIFRFLAGNYAGDKETSGFLAQLALLINSPFGKLFEDLDNDAICMMDIIDNRSCAYFGLSVQGYGAIARTFGKLFLSEIQIASHELGLKNETSDKKYLKPIKLISDEAGSILFKEFINLQNKGRSSGFHFLHSFQTMSDLLNIDPAFKKQIFANSGNLIIFNQPLNEDAQELSDSIGTFITTKTTNVTDDGDQTSLGTEREVREYFVNPQIIKDLQKGQCVLVTKDPNEVHLLKVRNAYDLPSIKFMKASMDKIILIHSVSLQKNILSKKERSEFLIDRNSTEQIVLKPIRNKKHLSGAVENDNNL